MVKCQVVNLSISTSTGSVQAQGKINQSVNLILNATDGPPVRSGAIVHVGTTIAVEEQVPREGTIHGTRPIEAVGV